ncbi:MAG TPA: ATP-dependent DNA helicase RecQ [Hanamia sp.]|nr:ATP-dependent DNA helicase RecQ [Hanamia sp.]
MKEPKEILKEYWGYEAFRPLQEEIINSILASRDTLALMPTGGGKSICFQVPSLMNEGLCLVISPLIALMKDQVANLKKKGIPALSIYSGMSYIEVKKTLQNAAYGKFKFLYVSPERLETELFLEYLPLIKINLIAVDEAHCISQWGYDFRPPYLRISAIREYYPNVPVLALTASATLEVQKDICEKLQFKNGYQSFHQSFERPNLSYSAFELSSKQKKLLTILKKVLGSGIVYCKTRKRTKEIAEMLNMNGIHADFYHAGLSNEDRGKKQENWINNKIRIIVCTNAFGMGIDKPDVRTVIHYDVPDALENYYQEAGRAGRDGKKSYSVLFYNENEINELKKKVNVRFPSKEVIKKVYGALCNFFQLPSGSGEGLSYDFDINSFIKNFKLDAFSVNSVLKILEQEELINYSEQFFSPSTIVFTTSKNTLNSFEKSHPQYDDVVKGLLRSYDGIFDFPAVINETQLAQFISIKKGKLLQNLIELKGMGIIDYIPQKEKPQIYFLKNRVKADDLFINEKNILKRKQAFEKRLEIMVHFATNKSQCRSKMIAFYFNDHKVRQCGICDNCLKNKNIKLSNGEFESISSEIKSATSKMQVSYSDLFQKLSLFKEDKIWKVLIFLQEENIITINNEGMIRLK